MKLTIKLLAVICLGNIGFNQSLFAAGFYLQELGTPSSIGTAGTSRTINNIGPEAAFGNPAGMTGITNDMGEFSDNTLPLLSDNV